MHGLGLKTGVVAVAVMGAVAVPSSAAASSCGRQVAVVWPEEGAEFPQGSMLMFEVVCGFEEPTYTVSVDGEAATGVAGPFAGSMIIEPAPLSGSAVDVEICVDEETCDSVSFTVTDPSSDGAVLPPDIGLAFRSQEDATYGLVWGLQVTAVANPANAGRPVFYNFYKDDTLRSTVPRGDGGISASAFWSSLPSPGSEVCATVELGDVYGNVAEPVTECTIVEEEPEGLTGDPPPFTTGSEPETTGTTDGDGSTGTSGEDTDPGAEAESSSGCRVGGSHSGLWGLLLVLGWRRRRQ
jgi:hypothetical protein